MNYRKRPEEQEERVLSTEKGLRLKAVSPDLYVSQLDIKGAHCNVSFTPLMEYVTWPALSVNLAFSIKFKALSWVLWECLAF